MRTLILTIILCSSLFALPASAQVINWQSLQDSQRHVANINVGWDYAATLGLGYAYRMDTKIPALFNAQFQVPAGEEPVDDFKAKLGAFVRVFKTGNFQAAVGLHGIFRKYHSDMVTIQNFGSEFTGTAGYYKPRWFVAAEFGFDKAITTHAKHTDLMRQMYPAVRDGWYIPTGGNFTLALQTGYSFKFLDLNMKVGKVVDQHLKTSATIPLTFQLGVNIRF